MINKNPAPRRKNIRLAGYDYASEGNYFITVETDDREPLFGNVVDGEMVLNEFGRIVKSTWQDLVNHNSNIGLDDFVVMPNHFHAIVYIIPRIDHPQPILGAYGNTPLQQTFHFSRNTCLVTQLF